MNDEYPHKLCGHIVFQKIHCFNSEFSMICEVVWVKDSSKSDRCEHATLVHGLSFIMLCFPPSWCHQYQGSPLKVPPIKSQGTVT